MSLHDRLDIAHWVTEFPLSRLRSEARDFVVKRRQELPEAYPDESSVENHIHLMRPKWRIVVGPGAVAINQQLRAESLAAKKQPMRRHSRRNDDGSYFRAAQRADPRPH